MKIQPLASGVMNLIHKPHYPTAMQMAKKFVCKEEIRPQLMLVYHDEQGGIWATDSHRVLHVADVHGFGNKFEGGVLVNPKTFEMAENPGEEGKRFYPNVQKIIPARAADAITIEMDELKVWHQAHKSMKQMSDSLKHDNYNVKLLIESTAPPRLVFKYGATEIVMNLPIQKSNYAPSYSPCGVIGYNAAYMADALETMIKLKVEQVNIQFTGLHSPFVLRSEDEKVTVMILPVRVY